jgi:cysteine-rich repeat protein
MVRLQVFKRGGLLLVALLTLGPVLAQAGGLTFVESQLSDQTVDPSFELRGAHAVAISPDDDHVYVAADGDGHGALSVWKRNPNGSIDFVQELLDTTVPEIEDILGVAVSPDGQHVYCATHAGRVVVFTRNSGTGVLTFLESHENGDGLVPAMTLGKLFGLALDPDGEHVYVVSQAPGLIAVFKRETTVGPNFGKLITFIETHVEQQGSSNSFGLATECHLRLPEAATFSPDGVFLYVAAKKRAEEVGSVVVFKRETTVGPNFGKLTFIEDQLGGIGGVPKFLGPNSLVVSPELGVGGDKQLYVASTAGNAVHVFDRDPGTGALTFVELQNVKSVKGAWSVGIDPNDGRYVYVTGNGADAIAVFHRDATPASPTFGRLIFFEAQFNGIPSGLKLDEPQGLAVAPNGNHLYVASFASRSLTAFSTDICSNGNRGGDEECDDGDLDPGDGCDDVCRIELCSPTPSLLCRTPPSGDSSLLIRDDPSDSKDQLKWKWKHGPATPIEDYGDPTVTAAYVICIYDNTGLLVSRAAPEGGTCANGAPCWTKKVDTGPPVATTRYTYKDADATPSGLTKVQLKPGTSLDLKAQIKVSGKGNFLQPPTIPLSLPVTLQLRNTETSVCWGATFSNTDLKATNVGTKFKAKSD